ncbi:diguanylate cyclase domain-containing protein [Salinicola endophyticus]|uniref:Diguanylate cyclase n=1 Tax=Salinicola endophyticus TaxID=1949083 RepID=A0AB74UDN0_9GAMM
MSRLLMLLQTRLALRTTAIILLIVGLLGVAFLLLAVHFRAQSVHREQQARLEGLLTTVERTAQIACFLNGEELARELADGLLSNDIVHAVRIESLDGKLLIGRGGPIDSPNDALFTREISSPFEPETPLCRLIIDPDQRYIDGLVGQASRFVGGALLLQLLGIGFCVVLVVVRYVTRPITGLSQRLRALEAETGQKLQAPRGNRDDEIGQLVNSVNAMIDNLVQSLDAERCLRLEREVEERRYRAIFDNVETGIFEVDDDGTIRVANPAFRRLFKLPAKRDLTRHPIDFATLVDPEGSFGASPATVVAGGRGQQWEVALGDEEPRRWVNLVLNPLEAGRLQGVAHDVTARKRAADAAEQLAVTDPLTGLGNRRGFDRRLAVMGRHHRLYPDRCHALVLLDFDHFKQINDTHGHHAGDRVLRHVGGELAMLLRQRDYVARLGGDEFVLLLEGCGQRDEVEALLARFVAGLQTPIELESGVAITIGVSIGVALLGVDTEEPQQALLLADRAMYAAKRAGRNTWRFHTSDGNG